jgi:hypothetical protein
MKPNSVYCFNHQGKGTPYLNAMNDAGFSNTRPYDAQVILIDLDNAGRVNPLRHNLKTGKSRLFVYPHSARPAIAWDGLFSPSRYTAAQFVCAPGHVDVLRSYGYTKPLHVTGWAYTPIKPFKPTTNPRRVLFAPIHPTKRGFLSELDRKINAATFDRLYKLVQSGEIELSVRFMRGLANNGLTRRDGVHYIEGGPDLNFDDAKCNDLVVSHQTYAYCSVALGIPVLMMSEETPPRNGGSEETFTFVRSWDKYKDLIMYPLDILTEDDTLGLIRRACESDAEIADWRRRIIGDPFNPALFVQTVRGYLM